MKQKVVTFGEVMLQLGSPGFARFSQALSFDAVYGGGEANVAVSLVHLGLEAEHVTRFPANDLGYSAAQSLRQYGVGIGNIQYGGRRLGLYFLENGAINRSSKIIYDRDDSAFAQIEPGMIEWERVLEGASWFHWTGITPALSAGAAAACKEAVEAANRLGLTVSSDVNARKNLWQYGKSPAEVMPELVEGCQVIMASPHDAAELFGIRPEEHLTGEEAEASVYRQLMERFPRLQLITNTRRGSVSASHNTLSAVMWNGERLLTTKTHDLFPIVARLGGGDAFFAGLIYGLLAYSDHQKALEFAVAASVLKHSIEGDANLATVEEVKALERGESGGQIRR
ncbi:sugar kinase [soil metagenome]